MALTQVGIYLMGREQTTSSPSSIMGPPLLLMLSNSPKHSLDSWSVCT